MKLIIDIPEHFYNVCKADEDAIEIRLAVKNGIPLDDVKAEIRTQCEMYYMDGDIIADEILSNIDKHMRGEN